MEELNPSQHVKQSDQFVGSLKKTKITCTKAQVISKCLIAIFNSPKKRTKKIDFTIMVPQVELFSFVILKN